VYINSAAVCASFKSSKTSFNDSLTPPGIIIANLPSHSEALGISGLPGNAVNNE
jgi:hypothetical protein